MSAPATRPPEPRPIAERDPIADHRRGVEVILARVTCKSWFTAPGSESYPPLSVQERMEHAAAWRLARGERPWRVARALGRDWPEFRNLMPELVRAVLDAAEGAR